ncbi:hypothetical protein D3C76_1771460 [compost metagenome]
MSDDGAEVFLNEILQITALLHPGDDTVTMEIAVKRLLHGSGILLNAQRFLRRIQAVLES